MKLPNCCFIFNKGLLLSYALIAIGSLSSCDSMIFDDQGDCSVHYRLNFEYSKNILNSDAFGSQVSDINVALYDLNGNMVFRKSESRDLSTVNDYYMDVDVAPGRYNIIAWCEGELSGDDVVSFSIDGFSQGDPIQLSGASLPLAETDGSLFSSRDIRPLFYGSLSNVEFPDTYGIVNLPAVSLTRDTNHLTIQFLNMNGYPLDPEAIEIELEGSNSQLNYQNAPVGDIRFTYTPWYVRAIISDVEDPSHSRASLADGDIPNGIQAELTTGRFISGIEQKLIVSLKESGDLILQIPLVEYLLLARGNYQQSISAQEYLDRYVDFSVVFFLDEGYVWDKTKIYINNWRVVPPQQGGIQYED